MTTLAIDTDTPESPGWWFKLLAGHLHDRRVGREGRRLWNRTSLNSVRLRPPLLLLDDYLRGDPPLHPDIHSGWADPFRRFLRMGRLNVADLVIGSTSARMGLRDFRTTAADDELGDADARLLMNRNELKLKSRDVHDWMLGLGDAYTIVTPPDTSRAWSLITAESPLQCITAQDPATGETLAGLKMFRADLLGLDLAYLFLPGKLFVAQIDTGVSMIKQRGIFTWSSDWTWDDEKSDDVPGGECAMVRFRNRRGVGDFEEHLNHLDRINDKVFNEWWIGKIQAFRQRAIKLDDQDDTEDDAVDEPVPEPPSLASRNPLYDDSLSSEQLSGIFTSAPDSMWRLPKDADIWESGEVNLNQITQMVDADLKKLAAMVRISLPSMTPDVIANGSAEGAQLMREEHVFHIEDRMDRAGAAWARTVALAFKFQGDEERSDHAGIQPMWSPAERYSLAEKAQAASQSVTTLPIEAIQADIWQYSASDVQDRLRRLRAQDQLFAANPASATPAVPPTQPDVAPAPIHVNVKE